MSASHQQWIAEGNFDLTSYMKSLRKPQQNTLLWMWHLTVSSGSWCYNPIWELAFPVAGVVWVTVKCGLTWCEWNENFCPTVWAVQECACPGWCRHQDQCLTTKCGKSDHSRILSILESHMNHSFPSTLSVHWSCIYIWNTTTYFWWDRSFHSSCSIILWFLYSCIFIIILGHVIITANVY